MQNSTIKMWFRGLINPWQLCTNTYTSACGMTGTCQSLFWMTVCHAYSYIEISNKTNQGNLIAVRQTQTLRVWKLQYTIPWRHPYLTRTALSANTQNTNHYSTLLVIDSQQLDSVNSNRNSFVSIEVHLQWIMFKYFRQYVYDETKWTTFW